MICSSCSSKRVNLKGGSIRACDDCFASFNPAGGRRAVKAGKGSLNADGHAHSARQDTPAQTLLGAPEPSVSRIEAEQNYETYQTADDATQANPNDNARRQLVSRQAGGRGGCVACGPPVSVARPSFHCDSSCTLLSFRVCPFQYESPLAENPNKCCACCVIC